MIKFFCLIILIIPTITNAEYSKRTILALWDSTEVEDNKYDTSPLHKHIEVIFNHYGLILKYHDINKSIPKVDQVIKKYKGVVTWLLDNKMKFPIKYLHFLREVTKNNLPYLILGELGVHFDLKNNQTPLKTINSSLNFLGLKFSGQFYSNPYLLSIEKLKEKKFIEFERTYEGEVSKVEIIENISKNKETWLKVNVKWLDTSSEVITFTNNGGYVQTRFLLYENPVLFDTKWRANPFKIIEKTFINKKLPIPDTNTLCGKRISYIHIDGDGFSNISDIDRKSYSGKIIGEQILKKYQVPTTVSIVAAEISSKLKGNKVLEEQVQDIFKLEYIEAASHTWSHPLSWDKNPSLREIIDYLGEESLGHKGQILAHQLDGYQLNYETEIVSSTDFINSNLLTKGKKSNLILWSGSCRPPKKALKIAHNSKLLTINGGDSRFDALYDSYSGLAPLYRQLDEYQQTYSSNSNENIYTNQWKGPYGGFKEAIQTYKKTESPVRIKPINIYYHFYSGEKRASLNALFDIYNWLEKQETNTIYVSDYVKIISDFDSIKIKENKDQSFYVSGLRNLKTLRFENEERIPDYKLSKNILGHIKKENTLYLHVGSNTDATIYLTNDTAKQRGHIKKCNGMFKKSSLDQFELKKLNNGFSRSGLFRYEKYK